MANHTVRIHEVGPRDGLQNEKMWVETKDKINWINQLTETGLPYIELTSFVHPKWIPALSDASEVVKGVKKNKNVIFGALVPNERGLDRALEVGIDEIAVFSSLKPLLMILSHCQLQMVTRKTSS